MRTPISNNSYIMMCNNTKVSVIIPNYNKSRFIVDCVLSVVNQTYNDIEIIIVDDCSTDDSTKIIKELTKKYENIRFFSLSKNKGVSFARNYGAKKSTGYYLTFLDSDDFYCNKNKIKNEVRLIKKYNDIAFSQWLHANENGEKKYPKKIFYNSYANVKTAICKILSVSLPTEKQLRGYLMTRRLFDEVGGYDEYSNYLEDFDFQCRLALKGSFKYTGSFGECYRRVPDGLSKNKTKDFWKIVKTIQNKYYPLLSETQKKLYLKLLLPQNSKFYNYRYINTPIPLNSRTLFISDYSLDEANSVRDIMKQLILQNPFLFKDCSVWKQDVSDYGVVNCVEIDGVKNYFNKNYHRKKSFLLDGDVSIFKKIGFIARKIFLKITHKAKFFDSYSLSLKRIRNIFKFDNVVMLTYNILPGIIKFCNKRNISVSIFLYDTILERPFSNRINNGFFEKFAIAHVNYYFVPSFFYDLYAKKYKCSNVLSYNLPLLIQKEIVFKSIQKSLSLPKHELSYFGQLSSFRNVDSIAKLLYSTNNHIDVFSKDRCFNTDCFNYHNPVLDADYYMELAKSQILVIFDNDKPYDFYLPSKVYSYVSFTKPIICIGNNPNSFVSSFFKEYPLFSYFSLHESHDFFVNAVNRFKKINYCFNEDIYKIFSRYLPRISCLDIRKKIFNATYCDDLLDENINLAKENER